MRGTLAPDTMVRERMLQLGDAQVYVREHGDGPPLLLINGLGSNAEMWGMVDTRLAARARTIVFDMPGSGRSPTPGTPLSIAALARVARNLLDELGHDCVDVLGFSLGGVVAQQLAYDARERVRRMALVATACGWGSMPPTVEGMLLLWMPLRYHFHELYWRTNQLLSPGDRALLRRVPTLTTSRLEHPPPLLGYAFQLAAGACWSSLHWIRSVGTPTLVLAGGDDRVTPAASGIQLARLLPESRLHVVPDGGHLFVFDPDGPAVPWLEDFFGSPDHARSGAWLEGRRVDSDEEVDAAFAASSGAPPYRWLSDAYRYWVERGIPPTLHPWPR